MMMAGSPPLGSSGNYKTLTIPAAKLGSADISSGYTVTLAGTFSYLKSFANGGSIANVNNVAFYADTGFSSLLGFERELHNLTTGQIIYHFKSTATLSHTVDTIAGYMRLTETGGNLAVPANAWRAMCKRRWGLGDGSTLSLVDSTGNGSALTNVGTVTATPGILSGGIDLNGSTQYLTEATAAVATEPMSLCFWLKSSDASAYQTGVAIAKTSANDDFASIVNFTDVKLYSHRNASNNQASVGHPLNSTSSAWHFYVSNLFDIDNATGFQDGVGLALSVTGNSVPTGLTDTYIGGYLHNTSSLTNAAHGQIAEPRIYSEELGPSEVKAMYNNFNSPSTFVVVT